MRTISISISESDFAELGLQNDQLTYNDWLNVQAHLNLVKAVELAKNYGLDKMTMEEITAEVRAVRDAAKNNN